MYAFRAADVSGQCGVLNAFLYVWTRSIITEQALALLLWSVYLLNSFLHELKTAASSVKVWR